METGKKTVRVAPIKTKRDHKEALERINTLMDKEKKTPSEMNELDILSTLVSDYEKTNFKIEPPHPIEAIKFRMDQMGISQKDLGDILGSRQRASEYLNKKIPLSISAIRILEDKLGIDAAVLIQEYELEIEKPKQKPVKNRLVFS